MLWDSRLDVRSVKRNCASDQKIRIPLEAKQKRGLIMGANLKLPVIKRSWVDGFSIGVLFFLLTIFPAVPYCGAVTIEALYPDAPGTGFNDQSGLTEEKRALLGDNGNNASTLGQARRNAFEHAASLLEDRLPGPNIIRVEASFIPFDEDETTIARTSIQQIISFGPEELLHIGYPPALAERIKGEKLVDGSMPHFIVEFSRSSNFYYGFREDAPSFSIDFVTLAIHELIHGLGFYSSLGENGSFPRKTISVTSRTRDYLFDVEQWQRIYDVQMYSEEDGEFIVDLEPHRREQAATSDTGLLWDGTVRPGKGDSCSYGQRMAELKSAGVASDGKPQLHAPPDFNEGSSITHVHTEADDIMEYLYPFPRDMDLSLGMLKDMGWEIDDDDFPPSCVPTGIRVTPTSGLVTTEGGGVATFAVGLDSEPMSDVVIPLSSSEPREGVADTAALEFTPENWAAAQTVTVTGINDTEEDGPKPYVIALERVQSRDRFYDGFNPDDVSVTNQDNDPEPDPTSGPVPKPEEMAQDGGGGGGCALAMEKRVENTPQNTVLNLFLVVAFLFSAALRRSPLTEK